jgi:hypothetical protein
MTPDETQLLGDGDAVVSQNADLVTTVAMPSRRILLDLDRPEDYAALLDSLA